MKKFTLLIVMLTLGVVGLYFIVQARNLNFNTNYQPTQPIAFSHKLHTGTNQIQCQYCHFAADKSRHAGIPPTELCLNCHKIIRKDSPEIAKVKTAIESGKNIEWIKVHHLPDYVYFNHSQHVRVAKLACQKCHGPVETMDVLKQQNTLAMGWCINCHRQNEIAPPKDHKLATGGDCSKCHY